MRRLESGIVLGLVLTVAAALILVRLASTPLLDPDESRFARTSVEMLRTGDLVVPTFEGKPRLTKPPLLHWIQSWLFRTIGVAEWTARLPSALATFGSLGLVSWIAYRRFGGESPLWAAAMFATMPMVQAAGRLGTLDALLSLHVLAVLALDLVEPETSSRQRNVVLGCLLGLAVMIKGPVGLVLPLLMMLGGRTAAGREILPGPGAALYAAAGFAIVVLPWMLALAQRVGSEVILETLRREALERYFSGFDHQEPVWFFVAVLLGGMFPWAATAALAILVAVRERKDPGTRTVRYLAAAAVVGLVFFSVGRSKLAIYVLPLAPILALLATWMLGRELGAPGRRIAASVVLASSLAVGAAGCVVAALSGFPDPLARAAWILAIVHAVGSAVAWQAWLRRSPRAVHGAAVATATLCLTLVVAIVLPEIARLRSSAELLRAVPVLGSLERPLVVVAMKVPSLTYYLDRIPEEVSLDDLAARLQRTDRPFLIFDEADLGGVAQNTENHLKELGRGGKYVALEKAER